MQSVSYAHQRAINDVLFCRLLAKFRLEKERLRGKLKHQNRLANGGSRNEKSKRYFSANKWHLATGKKFPNPNKINSFGRMTGSRILAD